MVIMLISKWLNNLAARRLINTICLTKREKSLVGQLFLFLSCSIFLWKRSERLLVSSSPCKELGGHHSILTTCKNPNRDKNQQLFLDPWGKNTGQTTASKSGETDNLKYSRTPEHFVLNKACFQMKPKSNLLGYYQSLTDKGNKQVQPTIAILPHLQGGKKSLKNTCEVHNPLKVWL